MSGVWQRHTAIEGEEEAGDLFIAVSGGEESEGEGVSTVNEDIRDLAELIAQVAQGVWEHIGTDEAGRITAKAVAIQNAAVQRNDVQMRRAMESRRG